MHGGADHRSLALHPAIWRFHNLHAGTIAACGAAPLPYSASPLLRRQVLGSTSWLCFSHWLRQFSMICAVIPVLREISARIVRFGGLIRTQADGATAERRDWANGWWSIGPQVDGQTQQASFWHLGRWAESCHEMGWIRPADACEIYFATRAH